MNKSLQDAFKDYLNNGNDIVVLINDENINKYNGNVKYKFPDVSKDDDGLNYLNISSFYENDDFRHFDLIEGSNHLVYNPEAYLKPIDGKYKENFINKWENDPFAERVCISHKNCHDGLGVKAVVDYHCKDYILNFNGTDVQIEHIELDYDSYDFDQLCKDVEGKIVYVGDFSFKKEQLEILMDITVMIIIVDHHLGAFRLDTADYDNVHIDMGYSGAMLAWKFFYADQKPPYIISLIEDRDLWNWFHGDKTKACNIAIKRNKLEFLKEYITDDDYKAFTTLNQVLVPYIKEVEQLEESYIKMAKTAKPYIIAGIQFHGLNIRSGISEICSHISRIFDTPSFAYWEGEDGLMQFSFRDATGKVDVAAIARMFSGNGHKAAAGCRVRYNSMDLNMFFINKKLTTTYYPNIIGPTGLFIKYGIAMNEFINTDDCLKICSGENKSFDDLFVIEKDTINKLVLKLNKGSVK